MSVPVLPHILRQHAEQAAFLWTVYDRARLFPEENPDMSESALADLVEQLEAHLDGLRTAGAGGMKLAKERFDEFPEQGELFVVRMLSTGTPIAVAELDLSKVRSYLSENLPVGS
jgi:hypothetical protein